MQTTLSAAEETHKFGQKIGSFLVGGEAIELVGDIGAGKTALTKGIADGMGITEEVQSPTFTISRLYEVPGAQLRLAHYDFYRLSDPGILSEELREAAADPLSVVVIEWADIVENALPVDRLTIRLQATRDDARVATLVAHGTKSQALLERIAA